MFQDIIKKWEKYCTGQFPIIQNGTFVKVDVSHKGQKTNDILTEIGQRLRDIDFIIIRVQALDKKRLISAKREEDLIKKHNATSSVKKKKLSYPISQEGNKQKALYREAKILTEAFYYSAHRIMKIIEKEKFLHLKKIKCPGVRDVRNWLIEHPKVFIQSAQWGTTDGFKLKAIRHAGQESEIVDAGLYKNAREFHDQLVGIFSTRQG